jgi:hypothetical protein
LLTFVIWFGLVWFGLVFVWKLCRMSVLRVKEFWVNFSQWG